MRPNSKRHSPRPGFTARFSMEAVRSRKRIQIVAIEHAVSPSPATQQKQDIIEDASGLVMHSTNGEDKPIRLDILANPQIGTSVVAKWQIVARLQTIAIRSLDGAEVQPIQAAMATKQRPAKFSWSWTPARGAGCLSFWENCRHTLRRSYDWGQSSSLRTQNDRKHWKDRSAAGR